MNRRVFGPSVGLIAVLAVALSACGGAGPATAEQPAEPSATSAAASGAAGTVAAVSASDIQVQNPRTGQVRVSFTPATSFTKTVPATTGDLVVGDCALATGAPQSAGTPQATGDPTAPLIATSVLISPATADGACSPGGFGGPRGPRGGGGPAGAAPPRSPNRPDGGSRGRGGTVLGKITSVSGSGFVVQLGPSNTTRSVVTTQTTAFSKTVTTDKSGLAVGQCVTAVGPSDDTGTVAASSISIRQPGPNGCQGRAGGPGRGGQGA